MSPHLLSVALVLAWCPAFRWDPSLLLKPDTDSMRYSSLCINRPDITVDELHVDTVENSDKIFDKNRKRCLNTKKIEITGLRDDWLLSKKGRGQYGLLKKMQGRLFFHFYFSFWNTEPVKRYRIKSTK